MTILPIEGLLDAKTWLESTISAAQRTLDNVVYTMKREATEIFAHQIQQKIDKANDGIDLTTSSIVSLSQYVTLLEEYEISGSSCVLRELSDRLNSSNTIVSNTNEVKQVA